MRVLELLSPEASSWAVALKLSLSSHDRLEGTGQSPWPEARLGSAAHVVVGLTPVRPPRHRARTFNS